MEYIENKELEEKIMQRNESIAIDIVYKPYCSCEKRLV